MIEAFAFDVQTPPSDPEISGVPLSAYAAVLAYLGEGIPLEQSLEHAGVSVDEWAAVDTAWSQRLAESAAEDGALIAACDEYRLAAQTHVERPLPLLDEDLRAWFDFFRAFTTAEDQLGFLETRGMIDGDIFRLLGLWQPRINGDIELRKAAAKILEQPPGPVVDIKPGPPTLKASTRRPRRTAAAPVSEEALKFVLVSAAEPPSAPSTTTPAGVRSPNTPMLTNAPPQSEPARIKDPFARSSEAARLDPPAAPALSAPMQPRTPPPPAVVQPGSVPPQSTSTPANLPPHQLTGGGASQGTLAGHLVDPSSFAKSLLPFIAAGEAPPSKPSEAAPPSSRRLSSTPLVETASDVFEPLKRTLPFESPASGPPSSSGQREPCLSLQAYASMLAEITHSPSTVMATIARYGLTPEAKRIEDALWLAKFGADPALRVGWMRELSEAANRLRGKR